MSDIEKYNPTSIMKNVTDKIKVTFAELIPDEEWENLVQKQVTTFFEKKYERYSSEPKPSEFDTMCQEILKELAREHIKEHMAKTYRKTFDKNNLMIDEAVKELVIDNAGKMFAGIMAQTASQAVWSMQNNMNIQR